jgi:hypothetical protein
MSSISASKSQAKRVPGRQAASSLKAKLPPQVLVDGCPVSLSDLASMVRLELAPSTKLVQDDEGPMQTKRVIGTLPEQSQVEAATTTLNQAISDLHSLLVDLNNKMEPHLPRRLFDDTDNEKAEGSPSRVPDYSSQASSTVNSINSAVNEVDRAALRVQFLIDNIVV